MVSEGDSREDPELSSVSQVLDKETEGRERNTTDSGDPWDVNERRARDQGDLQLHVQ